MLNTGTRTRTLTIALASLAVLLVVGLANAAAPVNLNTWSQQGATGAGNWLVAADGSYVDQTINNAPTMFVSPNNFLGTTVSGSIEVRTTGDDDFIGFVFGYNSPLAGDPVNDMDLILLDWKQGTQSGAPAGFYLNKVLGTHNGAAGISNELWPHTDSASLDLTQLGSPLVNAGWQDNQVYAFDLVYQQTKIEIYIQGGTGAFATKQKVYDVDIADHLGLFPGDVFPDGRFGFYNHSQASVRYSSFTQTDDPILQTTPADGGTLDLGSARVGTTSAPGDLTITNAAAVGSALTGTVGPASGEFAGPTPDAGFIVLEGANTVKQFTYTPAARGADTQPIAITSDGGNATITLAGKGVGPVYADDSGGALDFGQVDSGGPVGEIILTLSNISPDGEPGSLTDLTILSAMVTGPDAALFSLPDFVAGTVIGEGGSLPLTVRLDATGQPDGPVSALLTFQTDEGVALGVTGTPFEITLGGEVVPEPATLSLLAMGAMALVRRRRR